MKSSSSSVHRPAPMKKQKTTINALNHDILCMIFAFLDISQLIRCSAVCKLWSTVINKLKLLQIQYHKQQQAGPLALAESSRSSGRQINFHLEQLAFEQHRFSLRKGPVNVFQWKGHSAGINQCRMKRGLILTGVGDKVMRLWSVESYSCLDEYALPDRAPLIDFDFDEGKASQGLLTYINEDFGVDWEVGDA